jgi:hypothetical protein
VCDSRYSGSGCDVLEQSSTQESPALVGGELVGSDGGKAAVTTSVVASSASGASFLQLFDSLQSIIRLACLEIAYPLWYIDFVQGFSIVVFNVRVESLMHFLEHDLQVIEPPETVSLDVANDSNLEILTVDAMNTLSAAFITSFVTFLFVMAILTVIHAVCLAVFFALFVFRVWYLFGRRKVPPPASVRNAFIVRKFWIVFRSIYFSAFYAFGYPLFVLVGLQLQFGLHLRPWWETTVALVSLLVYVLIMAFVVSPVVRRPPVGEWLAFHERWDFAFLECRQSCWWIYLASTAVFAFDAIMVLLGSFTSFDVIAQLFLVALVSFARAAFYFTVKPFRERKNNVMQTINAVVDFLSVLLVASMAGNSRDSAYNQVATTVLAFVQMATVVANVVVGFVDMAQSLINFGLYLYQMLRMRRLNSKANLKVSPAISVTGMSSETSFQSDVSPTPLAPCGIVPGNEYISQVIEADSTVIFGRIVSCEDLAQRFSTIPSQQRGAGTFSASTENV